MKKLTLLLALLILSINYVKARKIVYSNLHETTERKNEHKYSGSWNSLNDTLTIDTLFKGVKKIVFSGHINNKILVRGSKRETVGLNFDYNLQVKGYYTKKKRRCKLSYTLKDSVLTVDLTRKNYVFIGMSYVKETTRIAFEVPENIEVTIRASCASYGDVEVKNLSNNNYHIQTTGGFIKVENINGNINLLSSYGDISLKNVEGKINANVTSGDITGSNVNVLDALNLVCSYGNVDLKLINPIPELMFDLKTSYGMICIPRENLSLNYRGSGKYASGKGNVKITAKSNSGNIIIR
jgi:hypothetical protein